MFRKRVIRFCKVPALVKPAAACLLLAGWAACGLVRSLPTEPVSRVAYDVQTLASPGMEGRKTGERGDSLAASYIRDRFRELGLQLLYDNGMQHFEVVARTELGGRNFFSFDGRVLELNREYLPYSFSAPGRVEAGVAFAGYGIHLRSDSVIWNDYATVDVRGKWVLMLQGDPDTSQRISPFEPWSGARAKVLAAADHGAAGVILVAGRQYSGEDRLEPLFYDKNSSSSSIPVFQVLRSVADEILASSSTSVAELEQKILRERKPAGMILQGRVEAHADVLPEKVKTANVVAFLPGRDPLLKKETIVAGAHYDHLGLGGPGSGSRQPDTLAIHYGADDNASGVGAILEIAGKVAYEKDNRRGFLFVAFGAEEMGLLGSRKFMEEPPAEMGRVAAMFNFDMVGRLDSSRALAIGGTGTSRESEAILKKNNPGFNLALSPDGTGPSDHATFYLKGIPVFFFSTGAHSDYHTPGDRFEKLNAEGIREVAGYAWQVMREVDRRDTMLAFTESGSPERRSRGARFRVTLGIMPDYAGMAREGMRVDAVTKNKPAWRAGILKGDIITAINGKPVANIYDYMNRLAGMSEGETISVDLLRDGKTVVVIVQL